MGEHSKLITKGTTPIDKSGRGTINFVKIESIDNGEIKPLSKITEEENENYLRRSRLEEGDILFSIAGTLGRTAIVKQNILPANTNQALAIIRGYTFEEGFLLTALNAHVVSEFVKRNPTVGAQPNLSLEQVGSLCVSAPNTEEQTAIGSFFRTLDDTITLYKRKLEGLRELKKAYLQQMFPQAGERVPKVRFAGFEGEWVQRILGDISIKVSEKNKDNAHAETFTNSAEHGIISQRDFFDKDISNEKNLDGYFVVQPDDFVYNPRISNFAPVGPIKRNLLGRAGVMSPLYYVFRVVEGDLTFIEKFFESVCWHEFMKINGDNGVRADRFNIKDSTFEQMPIPFPDLQEQIAIGSFLHNLDIIVVDQRTKLEKLLLLKSAYLSKMFI